MLDAGMVWLQQAIGADSSGYLSPDHFQQIFTSHGDIMVFFVTMGLFFGLMNWIIPLQIGARDLAFPFLNSLGLWLTVAGGIMINLFFVIGGEFANTGWLAIAPLSELEFNPGQGVDYLIWSLQLSGLGSLFAGINFIATIIKKRACGMTLLRLPLFCLGIAVRHGADHLDISGAYGYDDFSCGLTAFLACTFLQRASGGNQMMYTNLIWMWGHPEVYILSSRPLGCFLKLCRHFRKRELRDISRW